MTKTTVTTGLDAAVRILEDVVVASGVAISTWTATGSVSETLAAVSSAPVVKGLAAQVLSGGRVSGLLAALKLVRQALAKADVVAQDLPSFTDDEIAKALQATGVVPQV